MNEQQEAIQDLEDWVDEMETERARTVNVIEALMLGMEIQEVEQAIWCLRQERT